MQSSASLPLAVSPARPFRLVAGALLLVGLVFSGAAPAQAQQPDSKTVFDHLKEEGQLEKMPPSVLRETARRNPGALTPEQRRRLRTYQRKLAGPSLSKARGGELTFKDPVQTNGAVAWPGSDLNFRPFGNPQRVGDVNGDGVPDWTYQYLVADNRTSALSDRTWKTFVRFGGGDFSSTFFDQLLFRRLEPVGNFVGDAKADAIQILRNSYRILEGTSSGYSEVARKPALSSRVSDVRLPPVDLDGDGFDDVVFPSQSDSTITVLFGASDPANVERRTYTPFFRSFGNSFSHTVGNVDSTSSADPEIVRVAGFTNATPSTPSDSLTVELFDVNGSRALVSDTTFLTAPLADIGSSVQGVAAAELQSELVNVDGADLQEIILRDQRRRFTVVYTSAFGGNTYDNTAQPLPARVVDIGDVNGDGRGDFYLPSDTSIALGPTTVSDGLTPDAPVPQGPSETINLFDTQGLQTGNRLGDVNGDGDDETIAEFNGSSQFGFRLLDYSGGSVSGTDFAFDQSAYARQNVITTRNVGDWNGDGTDDVAFVFRDGRVALYFDDPATSLSADVTFTSTGDAFDGNFASIAAGDFTGNGQQNLVVGWSSEAQTIAVYEAGAGQSPILTIGISDLGIQATDPGLTNGDPGDKAAGVVSNVGDVNADGVEDFAATIPEAVSPPAQAAFLYLGQSSLSSSPDVTIDYTDDGASAFVGTEIEGLGDVNGDGIDDFAVGDNSRNVTTETGNASGGIYVHFGRDVGTPSFGAPDEIITPRPGVEESVTGFPWGMTSGDFNGDGTPDLAVKSFSFSLGGNRGGDAIRIHEGGPFFGGDPEESIRLPAFLNSFDTGDFATSNAGELTTLPPRADADTTADRLMVGTYSPSNALILSPRPDGGEIETFAPSTLLRAPDQNDGLGSSSIFTNTPHDLTSAVGDFSGDGTLQAVLPQPGNANFRGSPAYTYSLGSTDGDGGPAEDQPVATETNRFDASRLETGTETGSFRAPRVQVVFSAEGTGEGDVTVSRFAGRPPDAETVDQANTSAYYVRLTVDDAGTGSVIGDSSRVRFDVSALPGVSDPSSVTVYKRGLPDAGSFRALPTSYDANANELVAQNVSSPGEFVFASDVDALTRTVTTPTRLSATAASEEVTVDWEAVGDASQYFVYRSTSPIEWAAGPSGRTPFDTTAAGTTSLTDTDVEVGTTYYYRVTAATSEGVESGFSPQSSVRMSFVLGSPSGDGAVTAGDASLVRRFSVGLTDFDRGQRLAGDVSGDGTVNAADASLIQQFVVDLIDSFPAGAKARPAASLADVSGTVTWGRPASTTDGQTRLPLRLVEEPSNVRSVQFRATYDTSTVAVTDVTTADLPRGWQAAHAVDEATGTVRVALSGTTPADAGRLASLVVRTTAGNGPATLSGHAALYTAAEQSVGSVSLDTAPQQFRVEENYPNPFSEETTIEYALPEQTTVQVTVYDLLGRRVRTLADGKKDAGRHTVTLKASSLSSGTYFYRVRTKESTETGRMVIVR